MATNNVPSGRIVLEKFRQIIGSENDNYTCLKATEDLKEILLRHGYQYKTESYYQCHTYDFDDPKDIRIRICEQGQGYQPYVAEICLTDETIMERNDYLILDSCNAHFNKRFVKEFGTTAMEVLIEISLQDVQNGSIRRIINKMEGAMDSRQGELLRDRLVKRGLITAPKGTRYFLINEMPYRLSENVA